MFLYVLHADASTTGLGAVLCREKEGKMRVIAFASCGLSKSESPYPAQELEFLALKWPVTKKFCDDLYGGPKVKSKKLYTNTECCTHHMY